MTPVEASAPCGADLEYDPEFIVLSAKVVPKAEAQYGNFVGSPEPVNWSDIDRDCRRLMMRSKDMRLAVLFTRCRTRLAGAAGLAEGIGLLAAWLERFPRALHPQVDDADRDAALDIRMNALQAMTDIDGLLADVRDITLAKSTATRLQVRDVERAFAHPRLAAALAPDPVVQQLQDLHAQSRPVMASFDGALANLAAIGAWCAEHLEAYQPDLSPLTRLLQLLRVRESPLTQECTGLESVPSADAGADSTAGVPGPSLPVPPDDGSMSTPDRASLASRSTATPADREQALVLIRTARQWFEANEPSSPIPVLLKRAEQFVGKRYAEAVGAIPSELLAEWEQGDGA
ncbi:type VI secretion system ImpA family N-terminal domain-containing protein [Paraburkholderia sp.]|uniref:type VI secretion system protein TssA n=1 Tax=Paraburkholderia sp. TaxID=1926495 RepID=UPI00338DA11B